MAVELAVVMPLLLVVMVVAVDALWCMGECARFDQLASQKVLACTVSPDTGGYDLEARCEAVRAELVDEFSGPGEEVGVSWESAPSWWPGRVKTFSCTLELAPWPLSSGGVDVFGVRVPTSFTHTSELAVDPYTPGEVW